MKRRNLAFYSTGLLFASALPLSVWADVGTSSISGTWQAGDKSTELVVEQTGDNVHMTEQSGGKTFLTTRVNQTVGIAISRRKAKKRPFPFTLMALSWLRFVRLGTS